MKVITDTEEPNWVVTPQIKDLTDEEILTLAYEILETWNTKEALIEFARAILRKAQEND